MEVTTSFDNKTIRAQSLSVTSYLFWYICLTLCVVCVNQSRSGYGLLLGAMKEKRIGNNYQANVTPTEEWQPMDEDQMMALDENAVCIWTPATDNDRITDDQLQEFCTMAFAQYNYNVEQV